MAKFGGYPGGMNNMGNLMKQAQRMQRQMEEKSKELEEKVYTASAGGGAVTVELSGKKELISLKLAPEIVDPEDVETLQDAIVAAVNEAYRSAAQDAQSVMNGLGNLGGLGGFGL